MEDANHHFPTLGSVYKASGHQVSRLNQNMVQETRACAETVDGKVSSWEAKNNMAAKSWFPQNSTTTAWGKLEVTKNLGVHSGDGPRMVFGADWENKAADFCNSNNDGTMWNQHANATSRIGYIPKNGWNCSLAGFSTKLPSWEDANLKADVIDYDSSDSEVVYDSDDIDDYDSESDVSNKSHEKRKKSKWFVAFFDSLEKLTVEDIISQERQWHCPACQGGPGAIAWFRGLQSIIMHTKTKTTRRPRLHSRFSELLDEEMHRRGTSITAVSEAFDRWEGLNESIKDYEIVWPPIVIIMNTRHERDDSGKWKGMGNRELLDYFCSYAALKARHSYGPQGHSGMSALIFEGSAAGYLEAVRLHKHFKEQGRDRNVWACSRVTFCPGGKRQLYGYLADKDDLDLFNQHAKGNSMLKFEMKSYQEMVESQIKHINDDTQRLTYLEERFAKVQKQSKALAESLRQVSEKLLRTTNQNHTVMQRTKLLHEQNKEEMDAQEQFFKEQINIIYQAMELKEANFEELQRATQEKVEQSNGNLWSEEDKHRVPRIQENDRVAVPQVKYLEEFEEEREKLIKSYQEKRSAVTQKYWDERIVMERELEKRLTLLMEKHTPTCLVKEENENGSGE